jgi:hypothetical protein
MADAGIKKVTIKKQEFPPLVKLAEDTYGHFLRYRIVSEDKNRFSHWSKMTPLTVFSADSLPPLVDGVLNLTESSIAIVWDDELNRPKYDIFVRFDDGDFFYHGTSPIHTYLILREAGFSSVDVVIQIESADKEISEILIICELNAIIDTEES